MIEDDKGYLIQRRKFYLIQYWLSYVRNREFANLPYFCHAFTVSQITTQEKLILQISNPLFEGMLYSLDMCDMSN